jgi:hypothetical protein
VVQVNYVLKNGNEGHSWNFAQSLSKTTRFGLSMRGAYSYGVSRSISDPESTAATSFARNSQFADPNNPGSSYALWSPGNRVYGLVTFTHDYLRFGATGVSLFWEARESLSSIASSRLSYVFAGDMNGDSVTANDLIYIPRNTSEMNFVGFTSGTRTFTADEQATAFERYIQQDAYLSKHRGEYAQRNGFSMPMFARADLSVTQDLFHNVGGQRNAFQLRLDFINFSNLLNHNWGVAQRTRGCAEHEQPAADPDQPGRRRAGACQLPDCAGQQRTDYEDLSVVGDDRRRLPVHDQPAVRIQLSRCGRTRPAAQRTGPALQTFVGRVLRVDRPDLPT